jgi:anaerobic magnesium-protoporphyrin IX monomethyl ester cyclase
MPDCLIVSPPLSLSFPHEVPRHPPMQALYLAAVLERAGAGPELVDLYHRGPAFTAALQDEASAETPTLSLVVLNDYTRPLPPHSATLAVEAIRVRWPGTRIVAVGLRSAAQARALLDRIPALDAAGWGDAEPPATGAYRALSQGESLAGVAGLCWRDGEALVENEPAPLIADLDELPFPAWHLVDWRFYSGAAHRHRFVPFFRVMAQRGCPYQCTFCGKDGMAQHGPVRTRSVADVMEELEHLVERYGAREIQFIETISILAPGWMDELCEALQASKLELAWSCHVRANLAKPEQLERMAAAGCWNVLFGVETGSPELLGTIRKKIDLQQAKDTVRWARQAGIETTASFMFGHPGETPELAEETIRFAMDLDPDYAQFFTTKLHGAAVVDPSQGQLMAEWVYHAHDIYGPPLLPVGYRDLAQLEALQKRAYRRFYLRPRTVLRHLARINSWNAVKRLLLGALSLLRITRV